ncbi:response regulator [bacterium]|nr:response regulator [bacterium]MBU1882864.1 response regulator [bacterium]
MDKLRILIVDDDEDNRLILRATLRRLEGYETRDAVDGLDAVEIAESWRPHIILMDFMMPNLDGFEASKIIKERYPDTVIIVATAAYDSRIQDRMSAIGVDSCIQKPIDRALIRYKLDSIGSSLRLKSRHVENPSRKNAIPTSI